MHRCHDEGVWWHHYVDSCYCERLAGFLCQFVYSSSFSPSPHRTPHCPPAGANTTQPFPPWENSHAQLKNPPTAAFLLHLRTQQTCNLTLGRTPTENNLLSGNHTIIYPMSVKLAERPASCLLRLMTHKQLPSSRPFTLSTNFNPTPSPSHWHLFNCRRWRGVGRAVVGDSNRVSYFSRITSNCCVIATRILHSPLFVCLIGCFTP